MKLQHVFPVVIGAHLAVITLLFVTPGCQSGGADPSQQGASRGSFTASDTLGEHARHAQDWQTGPVYTPGTAGGSQLHSPSRPAWNVNDSNTASAVSVLGNDESVEVLQPVRSGSSDLNSAGFGELVPVTGDTSLGSGSVSAIDGGASYRVQTGDNLTRIASKHGVSVSSLMAANGLTRESANLIRVGQELRIPAGGEEASVPSAPSVATSGETYSVRSGDTLGAIAARHGTTVSALRSANNISGDRIMVGQKLKLPAGASAPSAQRSSATASAPSAGSTAPAPSSADGGYTVRSGETLGGIAARHGTTVQALMQANNIDDPRSLRAGQTLRIPGSSASAESSSTPAARSSTSGSRTSTPSATPTRPSESSGVEPSPTLPPSFSSPTPDSGFGTGSTQGSGDDLLNDLDSIPTVQQIQ